MSCSTPALRPSAVRPPLLQLLALGATLSSLAALPACPSSSENASPTGAARTAAPSTAGQRDVRTAGKGFTVPIPDGFHRYQGIAGEGRDAELDRVVSEGGVLLLQQQAPGAARAVIAVKGRPWRGSMMLDSEAGCAREANKHLRSIKNGTVERTAAVKRAEGLSCEFVIRESIGAVATLHMGTLIRPKGAPLIHTVLCQVADGDTRASEGCRTAARGFRFDSTAQSPGLVERDEVEARIAQVKRAIEDMKTLHAAVLKYRKEHARACPADLEQLLKEGLIKELPRDPWDEPYYFRCPREGEEHAWDLLSKGPDATENTPDDVVVDER